MENIRAKIKRRFSHKNPEMNLDEDYDEVEPETQKHIEDEVAAEEKTGESGDQTRPSYGREGSFVNRLIMHGNKKTEDQIAREMAEEEARRGQTQRV